MFVMIVNQMIQYLKKYAPVANFKHKNLNRVEDIQSTLQSSILPPKRGKVMFLQASVCPQGVSV